MTAEQDKPPINLDAEESVLGACLISTRAIDAVQPILDPADFYRHTHANVYRAIVALHADRQAVDEITVAAHLEAHGLLDETLTRERVHELAILVPASGNAAHHARIVAQTARRRRQWHAGRALIAGSLNGGLESHPEVAEQLRDLLEPTTGSREEVTRRSVDGWTFVSDDHTSLVALWGDDDQVLWAAGEPLMIVGPDGIGKTSLAQQLVLARLAGGTLLGHSVAPAQGRVLYLACDRPTQAARSMRRMDADRTLLEERLVVHRGPLPFDIATDPPWTLREFIQAHQATDVVIDSLKDITGELAKDAVGSAVNRAFQDTVANGIQLLALHHQRKAQPGAPAPKKLADVYGSRWLTAGMGSVLILWGEAGDLIVDLKHLKQPADEVGPYKLLHDHVHGQTTVNDQVDLELLLTQTLHGLTVRDASRMLTQKEDPDRNDIEKARRRLENLVARNLAERHDTPDGIAKYHGHDLSTMRSVTPVTQNVTPSRTSRQGHEPTQTSLTHPLTQVTEGGGEGGLSYSVGEPSPPSPGHDETDIDWTT